MTETYGGVMLNDKEIDDLVYSTGLMPTRIFMSMEKFSPEKRKIKLPTSK